MNNYDKKYLKYKYKYLKLKKKQSKIFYGGINKYKLDLINYKLDFDLNKKSYNLVLYVSKK